MLGSNIFFNSKNVAVLFPKSCATKLEFFSFLLSSLETFILFILGVLKFHEHVYMGLFSFNGFYTVNLKTHVYIISGKFLYINLLIFPL